MGLMQSLADSIDGVLGDQWKDFYTIPGGLASTVALIAAVKAGSNMGRGVNTAGSANVITNGSKFIVPEGYGLLLMQDGAITAFAAQPGGYEWQSDAPDSQSIFAGDGIVSPFILASWERFKFGGRPSSEQRAFFVSLKELTNNRFGTQSEIYWDDTFLNTQVGAMVRGSYSLRVVDPILFVKSLVSSKYLESGAPFDFTDLKNDASTQLYSEVIGSLSSAFAGYANDESKQNRMSRIQQDAQGFAKSLAYEVESAYGWRSERGIEIVSTAIVAIEYDEQSRELLKSVQRADSLMGARGNSNMQASVAAALQSAGEQGGAAGIFGIGIASSSAGLGSLQQTVPQQAAPQHGTEPTAVADDSFTALTRFKQMLDAGLISQEDYEAAKRKALGL